MQFQKSETIYHLIDKPEKYKRKKYTTRDKKEASKSDEIKSRNIIS
jgi:hypothetical protein